MSLTNIYVIGIISHIIIGIIIGAIYLDDVLKEDGDDIGGIIGGYCITVFLVAMLWGVADVIFVFGVIGLTLRKKYKQPITKFFTELFGEDK